MPFPTTEQFREQRASAIDALYDWVHLEHTPHEAIAVATLAWAEEVARRVIEAHCDWLRWRAMTEADDIGDDDLSGTPSRQGVKVLQWVLGERE